MALCLSTSIIGMAILTSTSAPIGNSGTPVDVDPAPTRGATPSASPTPPMLSAKFKALLTSLLAE
jgi:hypothetical protein